MKTILSIAILVAVGAATAQAQTSGDYKHPYGLTQSSKSKTAPVQTQRTEVAKTNRNYKNPQRDQAEVVVATPGRNVEIVVNPLTATDNYKRQNRELRYNTEALPQEVEIIVQDSTDRNRKKD